MWPLLCLLFVLSHARSYNTNAARKDGILNVHLVSHTHDDTGWLKTVEQYYTGSNETIQAASVHQILDTVIPELLKNPDRKFIYAEQGFFQRWWRHQDDQMKSDVQRLVKDGQLEFVNGGYCMHDEAATHYVDMIDQTTLGHSFLKDQFNYAPTVGWQIDPFGHSATQAALLSAEAGFNSLFVGRIDNQDRAKRILDGTMEFLWRPSPSLGTAATVWTSADFDGNYSPPKGLCFDVYCHDDPVRDDPAQSGYNVPAMVELFVNTAKTQAVSVQGNDIIFKMGSDFHYSAANLWYENLDKLIHYVNKDGRVNTFYSTPAIYAAAKLKSQKDVGWTLKTDDIFPYSDGPHAFWTGYFTSRPALKRYIRESSAFLQTSRHMDLFSHGDGSELLRFTEEQALNQHHDAVAGTEKQHVAFDYARRLATGVADGDKITLRGFAALLQDKNGCKIDICKVVNESRCLTTLLQDSEALGVVIYNPQARARTAIIQIPVHHSHWTLLDAAHKKVDLQVSATRASTIPVDPLDPPAPHSAFFEASLPALGHTTYFLVPDVSAVKLEAQAKSRLKAKILPPVDVQTPGKLKTDLGDAHTSDIVMENAKLKVTFDPVTGLLSSITNKEQQISTKITQEFVWYRSEDGVSGGEYQNSGAYIFRPYTQHSEQVTRDNVKISYSSGPVFSEVVQEVTGWLNQSVRLYKNSNHLELEWTVGSIPIHDMQGKEIVSRYSSDIASGKQWFTDSNGREMMERRFNFRPTWELQVTEPIAGNYYPVNAAMFLKDSTKQLTVLTDRSQGGASLASGQLEFMIHRRILQDDGRGVSEALNETEGIGWDSDRLGQGLVVRGKHYLLFETPDRSASQWRPLAQEIFSIPTVGLTKIPLDNASPSAIETGLQKWRSLHTLTSVGSADLPVNVNLMTLYATGNGTAILRLSHDFAIDEDNKLSQITTVDLRNLFKKLSVTQATELSLTANREKNPALKSAAATSANRTESLLLQSSSILRVKKEPSTYLSVKEKYTRSDKARATTAQTAQGSPLLISLAPMEIKTYQISYKLH